MASIQFYLDRSDLSELSEWLSSEVDIALIESLGEGRWRAVNTFKITASGNYRLFHIPSGPLPLLPNSHDEEKRPIEDPFQGWTECRAGADSTQPYFGPGHPAVFSLTVRLIDQGKPSTSSFAWIGNHYAVIGLSATDASKKWWQRLRRWIKKNGQNVEAVGFTWAGAKKVLAFPSARQRIGSGELRL